MKIPKWFVRWCWRYSDSQATFGFALRAYQLGLEHGEKKLYSDQS